jgi:anti-sigma factor ChrR (cupin superfamily)
LTGLVASRPATSLVRYAPGSEFPAHSHPGGEEILVLDGIFTENGSTILPAGICSPDGSSHQPSSRDGTTIFVKLRQMSADERQPVRINTQEAANWHGQPQRQVCPLFSGFRNRSAEACSGRADLLCRLLAEQNSFF